MPSFAFAYPAVLGSAVRRDTRFLREGNQSPNVRQARRTRALLRPGIRPRDSPSKDESDRSAHSKPVVRTRAPQTRDEFDTRMDDTTLPVCFVGMSNCGKSHWSGLLADEYGFERVCVDDEIEGAIEGELQALGYSGIDGMAEWMGFPTDDRFAGNEARYLELEESITREAVGKCMSVLGDKNFVLDTTGSVVYLNDAVHRLLRERFLVIHLEAEDTMLEEMTENYFVTPKPVAWGDCFNAEDGEEPVDSLRRCYPDLLRTRREMYRRLADVTVPGSVSLSRDITTNDFVQIVRNKLESAEAAVSA